MRALYWFRNDLRIHDNEAIHWICKNASEVLFVYSFPVTFNRAGRFRRHFQLQSLLSLKSHLSEMGQHLYVTSSPPEEVIPTLCTKYRIHSVVFSEEFTSEEMEEEQRLRQRLHHQQMISFDQRTLIKKKDLPFPIQDMPLVFTDFRLSVETVCPIEKPRPLPLLWPQAISLDEFELDLVRELKLFPIPSRFTGGETQGLHRLRDYIWEKDRLKFYKDTRNGLLNFDDSSKFSPWLANGCLSARQIHHEVSLYEAERVHNDSTYWMKFELLWRDYFKFYALKHGPFIFRLEGISSRPPETANPMALEYFNRWKNANTGNDFIDANMKELNETGFMSNRGRQVVASYLAKTLKSDWRWGARYFEEMLIDYDAASNWGNWNYVAGVGSDPRDRVFNATLQAQTYDPQGNYVRRWLGDSRHGGPF